LFKDPNLAAIHAKRVTIQLAHPLRRERSQIFVVVRLANQPELDDRVFRRFFGGFESSSSRAKTSPRRTPRRQPCPSLKTDSSAVSALKPPQLDTVIHPTNTKVREHLSI
jgi:hypothetical protein